MQNCYNDFRNGGFGLAMNTIEKIREAELASDEAEKKAVVDADNIVAHAEDEAGALKVNLTKQSKAKAEELIADAEKKSEQILNEAKEEASKESEQLRSSVEAKKAEAIDLILGDLTS